MNDSLIQNKKCKTSIIEKTIPDPPIHNSKYVFQIQKSIIEKNIPDPPICNRN